MTHAHFDHVGALEALADCWDAPIYAHALEIPYLSGRARYLPPDPMAGGGLMAWLSPFFPRGPVDVSDRLRPLPLSGEVPGLPEWRWIHTPGHTPGHVSLWRERDRLLVAGDAFVTTAQESAYAVATQEAEVHGPPTYFTPDWDAAGVSVRTLAELEPATAVAGHGLPLHGPDLARALRALADQFEEVAVPRHFGTRTG
jgi:glyoxylase-like metal-dependent hydrolase (beta-lactamase superfamily II)